MSSVLPITSRSGRLCLLSTLAWFLLSHFSIAHAAPPDAAGQAMREMQKQPDLSPPKETVPFHVEGDAAPDTTDANAVRILIKSVRVSGSRAYSEGELAAMLTDLLGEEHTLAEWEAGATRITAWYRQHGYVVARAYLPAQEIKDGVLRINVLEGEIGQVQINNQARLFDLYANDYVRKLQAGDALQAAPVDRTLLLLNDTPGIGSARASLQPGASVGTSDLIIELDPAVLYNANVELDNYGSRYTGEQRLGGALAFNSPLKRGDQLTLRALVSDQNMSYTRLAYQLPIGGDGLKVGWAYSNTRYYLGKEFATLKAHGMATSTSLYATYPFIRSQLASLYGTLTWESKELVDQTDVPLTTASKQVRLFNLGVMGKRQDSVGGGGITVADASLVSGELSMDGVSRIIDAFSARSNGMYTKLSYNLNRLQQLSHNQTLSVSFSGQQANTNLNSSEKFSLGGVNGVRAYPQGEGVGDEGWMANVEVRHNLLDQLQGVVFYDQGEVTINRTPFTKTANVRRIGGGGLGLNAQYGELQFKTSLAWRTSGGQPLAEPASLNRNPRLWLQISGQF
ncbi:MAG: ShlB/FhaC/HecB family hemolysin secretion/activation protein [Gallionella sp.]|nr:ShlB/FhaC/HecB family hemolysin secretion/activation protein [Gallionella sp.]MDD4958977.1 ShlB/FhaC/HecB family hemolysin secretion/activation protein [Gallionella sp.]